MLDDGGYHELRAAYACHRYEDLTGYLAPVFMANESAGDYIHFKAVEEITNELGHDRLEVMDEYIGIRIWPKATWPPWPMPFDSVTRHCKLLET